MDYNPPFGSADPNAPYFDRNTAGATSGSVPPAAAIEHPQREIVNAITAAGLTPDDGDLTQLSQAISVILNAGLDGKADEAATQAALDGKQDALGYTPVNKAGDTMTGPLFMGGNRLRSVGDGITASDAVNVGQFSNLKSSSGYQRLPQGLLLQWTSGIITNGNSSIYVSFPISFPTAVFRVFLTRASASNPDIETFAAFSASTTGGTIRSNSAVFDTATYSVFAIGY